jgi:hypothetical protein
MSLRLPINEKFWQYVHINKMHGSRSRNNWMSSTKIKLAGLKQITSIIVYSSDTAFNS